MEKLKMLLKVRGSDVERKFDELSTQKTSYGQALTTIINNGSNKSAVKDAFPANVHKMISKILSTSNQKKYFYTYRDVPWYLDLMARAIIKHEKACTIVIKACNGHQFFDIYQDISGGKRKLLLQPFFQKISLPEHENNDEAIRGLADTFLFLAPRMLNRPKQIKDLFNWFEIVLRADPVSRKSSKSPYELQISPTVKWQPSTTDERKQAIYIYSTNEDKVKPVLLASPNFRVAVEKLSEVWHNPISKSVLLSASPGSGKEELKELLIYALDIEPDQFIEFSAPQAAGSNFLHELYRILNKKPLIEENLKEGKYYLAKKPLVLFFDEIHHQSVEPLRTLLLRFMETPKLEDDDKVVDCKGILYIFTASKRPEELRSHKPPDFWTRIEYTVLMEHPLLIKDQKERSNILQQYFSLFWRITARSRRRISKVDDHELINKLAGKKCIEDLSLAFAHTLDSPLIPIVSMRMIRSIVNRLFSKSIYFIRTTKSPRRRIAKEIRPNIDRWIVEIFEEIASEIKPQDLF